ncbi:S46 family peptidase [Coralloluteibacterium stylophorae]|uniref:Dipeptidyl-peptidase n=2 Tax=Coralloluteibacterium stylophorae TaxID=1776034 RepID=A0A8J7VTF2_9GAMM|nr:S46 family peptidase [Coralloluteibacterium stylophorae]
MWQPHQMADLADVLRERGLEMDPADLSDLTSHPLDAVIGLGFCTASFVSPQGLIVTNHHCAYGAIQYNSTPERDLISDGFLARSLDEELPADPSLRVYVTQAIDEVTDRVTGSLPAGLDDRARFDAIDAATKALVADCEAPGGLRCGVYSFFGGLRFYLVRQMEIRDVRLVHAPPDAIGKFGGDVDNFEWPRHTGDYSFMRAYVGPDGKPADYAKENVPYRPDSWLRVAEQGPEAGDFVMVAGYPGSTNRYRRASEVAAAIDWRLPTMIDYLERSLDIIGRQTEGRDEAAIKYAATVASLNNALKLYRGQRDGFARIDAVADKQAAEAALLAWLGDQGASRRAQREAVAALEAEIAAERATRERDLWVGLLGRSGLVGSANLLYRQARESARPDAEREAGYQARDRPRQEARLRQLERRYDPQVDRALLAFVLQRYAALPADQRVAELDRWLGLAPGGTSVDDLDARLDALYAGTALGDTEARLRWFGADAAAIEASDDSALALAVAIAPALRRIEDAEKAREGRFSVLRPQVMQATIDFNAAQGRPVYPDANNSLRLTFGTVQGYAPRDAVRYEPFTTLAGIAEKHTGAEPFDAPAAELEAIAAGAGARYRGEALDAVPVNFLSDVDTTGGNSGSPTLNARGELVGLLFDGNYESLASDYVFNPDVTRSIHVDARYMRWVMDTVSGADNLLEEMGLPHGEEAR